MNCSNHLQPRYRHEISGAIEQRIDHFPPQTRAYSPNKANFFSQRNTTPSSTCFEHVTRLTADIPSPHISLEEVVSQHQNTLVALSGGLDSFLIATLIHRTTGHWGITDLIIIETDQEEFMESLTPAIKSMEVPLYNLHPVSKWIFVRKIKQLGFDRCLTGDGADQIFDHDDGHDYLPLVSPDTPDHNKTFLRELGEKLLPPHFAWKKKRKGMTPFIDLKKFCKYPEGMGEKESTLYVTQHLLQTTHQ